ncbi:hypothetical protein SOHN41_02138 [Shewanella sp. HN-41]|nr:hypothetical protein SOHN41_02138 [Shewanella sp. HN-41]
MKYPYRTMVKEWQGMNSIQTCQLRQAELKKFPQDSGIH